MLWFDNDPKTGLGEKITKAADYYRQKYGFKPTAAMVHPSALQVRTEIAGVRVAPMRAVLPGHIWIGMEEKTA